MSDVRNCSSCGRIYRYNGISLVCPNCLESDESDFRKVRDFLYDNPNRTALEVSEATEVSITKIKRFLKEDRLVEIKTEMANLGVLECERCGKFISSGKYCTECQKELGFEFKKVTGKAVNVTKSNGSDKMFTATRRR